MVHKGKWVSGRIPSSVRPNPHLLKEHPTAQLGVYTYVGATISSRMLLFASQAEDVYKHHEGSHHLYPPADPGGCFT